MPSSHPSLFKLESLKETLLQSSQLSQEFSNSKTSHGRLELSFLPGITLLLLLTTFVCLFLKLFQKKKKKSLEVLLVPTDRERHEIIS